MTNTETNNPTPETDSTTESAPTEETVPEVLEDVTAEPAEAATEQPAVEAAPEAEPVNEEEAIEAEEPETAAIEAPAEVVEKEPAAEPEPSSKPKIDYLGAALLDSITTITPAQLESMERSEIAKRDEVLEELVNSSVGDIREDKVITGRVIGTNDREVLVDIGFKSEGIIPRSEFADGELPQIGEELQIYLVRLEDQNGQTVLSKEKADFMHRWADIREKADTGEVVVGRISRRIKGGLIVDLKGVPAFLPGSQIDVRPVKDFDDFIGREFEFKIVKLNEARKNIVLSRKELLEADIIEKRKTLIEGLHVGQVLEGRVKNITDFGVFVDLGGLDGLLHITDLSWGRVNHPSEVVGLDDPISVKVIDFDPERQRVSLGLKQLQPHPWETVQDKYPVSSVVDGKVVSMTNYGAFIEIEKGVEGLVHISEMSWTRHVRHPSEILSLGESIQAKILNVDIEDRKLSLGLKQLEPDPWDKIEERYQIDTIQQGKVRNLTQFGAFVELEEGIDGLIHITDLSWTKNIRHPKEVLSKGDEVEVRVLDASRENRRIALGLKQVHEDPWPEIEAFFTSGKRLKGRVFRVLEKGIIFELEKDMEGIVPFRELSRTERKDFTDTMKPGDEYEITVQELSADEKKVILMAEGMDLLKAAEKPKAKQADQDRADDAAPEQKSEPAVADAAAKTPPAEKEIEVAEPTADAPESVEEVPDSEAEPVVEITAPVAEEEQATDTAEAVVEEPVANEPAATEPAKKAPAKKKAAAKPRKTAAKPKKSSAVKATVKKDAAEPAKEKKTAKRATKKTTAKKPAAKKTDKE